MLCVSTLLAISGTLSGFDLVKDSKTEEIVLPVNAHLSTKAAAQKLATKEGIGFRNE